MLASEDFSSSARRPILSSVIVVVLGSDLRVATQLLPSTATVATGVDKSPAYTRPLTVASAGDLPTAATPPPGTRPREAGRTAVDGAPAEIGFGKGGRLFIVPEHGVRALEENAAVQRRLGVSLDKPGLPPAWCSPRGRRSRGTMPWARPAHGEQRSAG
jgi:hypothetical protein